MLKTREIVLIALFVSAIWVVVFALQSDTSAYYQICETNQYTDKERCAPHHILYVAAWYIGYWFNAASAIITAFATAAIGCFTYTLKQSTDRLWEAGEKQFRHAREEALSASLRHMRGENQLQEQIEILRQSAVASAEHARIAGNALTNLERPYVFIFGVRGIKQDTDSRDFYVEYTVTNYGKMPAIIEAPHIGFAISEKGEPPIPSLMFDGHNLMASPILQAGEQRKKIREYFPAGMLGEDVIVRIERITRETDIGDSTVSDDVVPTFNIPDGFDVFFRAVIRYRGPSTTAHETEALWLYNPSSMEFVIRGGHERNYVS